MSTSPERRPIGVVGASGRTGHRVVECLLASDRFRIGAAVVSESSSSVGDAVSRSVQGARDARDTELRFTSDLSELRGCCGVIDFSAASVSAAVAALCLDAGVPLLMATTGHSAVELDAIHRAATGIPVLLAPNTSLGAAVLASLSRKAYELLGQGYDAEVMEIHHKMKRDAPSGTAKNVVNVMLSGDSERKNRMVFGREGLRKDDEVGVVSLRGGDVPGDHTVYFLGASDRIEISHKVNDRAVFARGSLEFMERLIGKKPGLYTVFDLLG